MSFIFPDVYTRLFRVGSLARIRDTELPSLLPRTLSPRSLDLRPRKVFLASRLLPSCPTTMLASTSTGFPPPSVITPVLWVTLHLLEVYFRSLLISILIYRILSLTLF